MGRSAWMWDQHACLPLKPEADVRELDRYDRPGGGFVSVNVGYAPQTGDDVRALVAAFRRGVEARPRLSLATTLPEIAAAREAGVIGVAFDLEDSAPLDGDLGNVRPLVEAGVRTLLPTYNHANAAGSGCLDTHDTGLTRWGADLVREMNAAGMVADGSHCSERTGLDLCAVSDKPVVYSHSCLKSVWDHPRNITDDQAVACAETGGVVGITGVGIFLGPNTPTLDAMACHLEAAVELVGIEHVGVSTDHSFDQADFHAEIAANPGLFDESYTRWGPLEWVSPELFVTLDDVLLARGWSHPDIDAVTSGNFLRVAHAAW